MTFIRMFFHKLNKAKVSPTALTDELLAAAAREEIHTVPDSGFCYLHRIAQNIRHAIAPGASGYVSFVLNLKENALDLGTKGCFSLNFSWEHPPVADESNSGVDAFTDRALNFAVVFPDVCGIPFATSERSGRTAWFAATLRGVIGNEITDASEVSLQQSLVTELLAMKQRVAGLFANAEEGCDFRRLAVQIVAALANMPSTYGSLFRSRSIHVRVGLEKHNRSLGRASTSDLASYDYDTVLTASNTLDEKPDPDEVRTARNDSIADAGVEGLQSEHDEDGEIAEDEFLGAVREPADVDESTVAVEARSSEAAEWREEVDYVPSVPVDVGTSVCDPTPRDVRHLHMDTRELPAARRKIVLPHVGLSLVNFDVRWNRDLTADMSSFTAEKLLTIIETEICKASSTDLSCVRDVFQAFTRALPFEPRVEMDFHKRFPRTQNMADQTVELLDSSDAFRVDLSREGNSSLYRPLHEHNWPHGQAKIRLPVLKCPFLSDGDGQELSIGVWFHCAISATEEQRSDNHRGNGLLPILSSVSGLSKELLAETRDPADFDDLATKLARRLSHAPSLLPGCFRIERAAVRIGDSRTSRMLGKGAFVPQKRQRHALQSGDEFERTSENEEPEKPSTGGIFVAIGSNVGDRVEALERGCQAMDDDPDIRVRRTSQLYETEPMYVKDQERFLNGVCEVSITAKAVVYY